MKLAVNVAAQSNLFASFSSLRRARWASLALASAIVLSTGAALALDGIDLSAPADEAAQTQARGECPRLIQIKYPFLRCTDGQIGLADGDDTWEKSRQIPLQEPFIEGDGYFGPELNRDRYPAL